MILGVVKSSLFVCLQFVWDLNDENIPDWGKHITVF